ncbi:uncharacterized protein RCO7_05573 [Rhynchosporium graminicola]|uniref:Heterokaryon incompatibility domain-containing protein n=1 Tax=Rhynchosporium graminicola TaxID=2792576 RepID=A0A1E1LMU1_9HELO|nr:uncharacterized protein RCO7_05573 [Rhynchosporium commune]
MAPSKDHTWFEWSVSDPSCESVALPIRLVDVGSDQIRPFLAETKGKRGSYLTLSHRWGKGCKTKTTVDNIDEFKQAVPVPQTFKDAIARDKEDWLQESANLGQIFQSSSFTLAVLHALDDESNDRGLFIPRPGLLAVTISSLWYEIMESEWYYQCFGTAQEQGNEQGDEQGLARIQDARPACINSKSMGATTAKFFADVFARDYSTSKLSKRKVNRLAMPGVCSKFEEQYGQNFYAGILMMVQVKAYFGKCQRVACQNIGTSIPPWTWASRSSKPSYHFPEPSEMTSKNLSSSISFQTQTDYEYNNRHGFCEDTCV